MTFARTRSVWGVFALGLAATACSGEKKGQIVLALQTDMSLPDDITRVKIEVKADGQSRHDRTYVVDPTVEGAEKIPATLSIVAGEKDNETIELKVIALRPGPGSNGLEPRTLNKTVTTIPAERVAMLNVPMQWLCNDSASEIDDDEYESNCEPKNGKETSCVAGTCKDVKLNSSKLPDFSEQAVFGGSDPGSGGRCFPTEACFDAGLTLVPDENCVVSFLPESDEIINFAVLAKDGGICRESGTGEKVCYVALDKSEDAGWFELEEGDSTGGEGGAGNGSGDGSGTGDPMPAPAARRFQLPQKVCDRINETDSTKPQAWGVRVSTDEACEVTKTAKYPTCGPWSSVGAPVEAPPAPPVDADEDGYKTTDVGGDDCNDADDTINPAADEICDDGIDNDCNDLVDDCTGGVDADGDGVDDIDSGGTDCDDSDNTIFPGALEVCDEIDNDCDDAVDDSCLADAPFSHRLDFSESDGFQSTASYAMYQQFESAIPFDLDETTITFLPNSNFTRYTVRVDPLDWDTDVGELLPNDPTDVSECDDCYTTVPLEFPFNFYGVEYTTVFPSTNGYLTFGQGDTTYEEDVGRFLAELPRIAAFWSDLDTRGGDVDQVLYSLSASKLVVTYQNIQLYNGTSTGSGSSNTFQFVLYDDGTIQISYDGMEDIQEASMMGITPGSLSPVDCAMYGLIDCSGVCTDLNFDADNCGTCGTACASNEFCYGSECIAGTACNVINAPCDGTCVGSCTLEVPGPCTGDCYGTCSGACSAPDGDGGCAGSCDGDCDGQCLYQYGGECADTCTGSCYTTSACTAPPGQKPCIFAQGEFMPLMNCADLAQDAAGNQHHLICDAGVCQCCTNGNCTDTTGTANTVCQTLTTMRDALIRQCLPNTACTGATCPSTPPPDGAGCNATDLAGCVYLDGTSCSCGGVDPPMFTCAGM